MAKTDVEVTGSVTISVDDQGVEAKLRFVRDPDGPKWNLKRILDELTSQDIKEGISHEEIQGHLERIAKKGLKEDSFVAASGLPVEHPVAEQLTVLSLPVPEEMKEVAGRIVRNAGAPEITVQRTETVKRQKQVTTKPKLPFGKPKVESVEVTESRPVTEKIYVDPAVEGYGYVTSGQKVGDLTEAVAGSPGRSVHGEILHARVLPDAVFHLADGIEKRGQEAYATTEGILRWGRNWADLIPFSRHAWNVSLSPDKATCRLTLHPGNPELPPPEADEIIAAAKEIGYPEDSLLSKEEIAATLAEAITSGTPLDDVPISESRDASFDIFVSEDKMQAILNITKGKGRGKHLVLKEVGKAIKESGLRGMDLKKVGADVSEFYRGPDTELIGYVLAEGKPPTAGPPLHPDFSLRFMFEAEREAIKTRLTENADAAAEIESWEAFPVDEIDEMAIVEREQRIVGFPEPVIGEAGVTVYGEPVPGLPGESPELKLFENLDKKGIVVIATHAGVLDLSDREGVIKVRVRPHRDGSVAVRVSPDKLQATLTARDGEGSGRRVGLDQIRGALEAAGVTEGIDADALLDAAETIKSGKRVENAVVARGRPPVSAAGNQIEYLISIASGEEVTTRKDGSVDYRTHDTVTTVGVGTKILRIIPSDGVSHPGVDVHGKEIPPADSPAREITPGKNIETEVDADGVTTYVATTAGELELTDKAIDVVPRKTIKGNVDMAVGNVKFPGPVEISGSVLSGFYVMSSGDVSIGEGVEAALVSAEGDVLIRHGVRGAGKAVIRSKGNIGVGFAEQATLLSVKDVTVISGALLCTIKCNGIVTHKKDKNGLVGGEIRARKGLDVFNLGSPSGAKTSVSFGQDYLIMDQIEREEGEIEKLKRLVTQIDRAMQDSEGAQRGKLDELRKKKRLMLKAMEKRSLRLFTLRERFEEHYPSSVKVRGTLFPGITFESHGRTLEISQERKSVEIVFDRESGRIIEKPLEKEKK
jgi:uncharacterized protein